MVCLDLWFESCAMAVVGKKYKKRSRSGVSLSLFINDL